MLTGKGFSLELKGKVYNISEELSHSSETWPVKKQRNINLDRTGASKLRCMWMILNWKKIEKK